MIETLPNFPDNVVAFACKGHVTKEDYDATLVPRVEEALKQHEKVRLYYEIGADFSGIDPAAVWEDIKVGFEHLSRWERIAIVTDVEWIKHSIQIFGFLMPGKIRFFSAGESAQARDWIATD